MATHAEQDMDKLVDYICDLIDDITLDWSPNARDLYEKEVLKRVKNELDSREREHDS